MSNISIPLLYQLERVRVKLITAAAAAGEAVVKTTAALAYPAYLSGRYSGHKCVVLYIPGHYRSCSYECAAAHGMPAHDGAVGSK